MRKHKITVFTAGRSDFGILKKIIKDLSNENQINLYVVVGPAHSTNKFGTTKKEIQELKLKNIYYIKSKFLGSKINQISNYFNDTLKQSSNFLNKEKIKFGIVLGDRYETMAFSLACFNNGISLAHFCGGTTTLGSKDNIYRKIISSISKLHLVETIESKKNLLDIGIRKKNIFVVGAPALEQINLKKKFIKEKKNQILFSFHPETNKSTLINERNLKISLEFLKSLKEKIIITYPNADEGFENFIKLLNKYKKNKYFSVIKNLGIIEYHKTLMESKILIGNTSSGIIESASFKIPFINLGERQKGRFQNQNTINSNFNKIEMKKALIKANSNKFLNSLNKSNNIYYKQNCSKRSVNIIKSFLMNV